MKQLELLETEKLLTKRDLSQKLRLSMRTIDRRIAAGLFPQGFKIGAAVRWRESVIDRFLRDMAS
jgi:predicted DNA-binding transcriptional regulator AlpA